MKISHDEIRNLARLARIEIGEQQFDRLAADLASIVAMVDQLQQVDLTDVQVELGEQCNGFRADVPQPSMPRGQILQNAPEQEAGCILVPRVIE